MPITPSVDVETGNVSNGPVHAAHTFTWTCSAAPSGTSITVHARLMPNGQPWFQTSSGQGQVTFNAPGASAAVTAEAVSPVGGWTWTATGVVVGAGAHVNVSSTMPKAKAS
ncbi:MAG: hypothetical protein LAP86_32305 [Acidobacteriia bacterium]|nr:hypothetical protein [Terriglobia bacterium]